MEQARKEGAEKEKERKEADREEEIKLELLDASLKQVMRYGWSKEAVRAAAEELGRPSVVAGLVNVQCCLHSSSHSSLNSSCLSYLSHLADQVLWPVLSRCNASSHTSFNS